MDDSDEDAARLELFEGPLKEQAGIEHVVEHVNHGDQIEVTVGVLLLLVKLIGDDGSGQLVHPAAGQRVGLDAEQLLKAILGRNFQKEAEIATDFQHPFAAARNGRIIW